MNILFSFVLLWFFFTHVYCFLSLSLILSKLFLRFLLFPSCFLIFLEPASWRKRQRFISSAFLASWSVIRIFIEILSTISRVYNIPHRNPQMHAQFAFIIIVSQRGAYGIALFLFNEVNAPPNRKKKIRRRWENSQKSVFIWTEEKRSFKEQDKYEGTEAWCRASLWVFRAVFSFLWLLLFCFAFRSVSATSPACHLRRISLVLGVSKIAFPNVLLVYRRNFDPAFFYLFILIPLQDSRLGKPFYSS